MNGNLSAEWWWIFVLVNIFFMDTSGTKPIPQVMLLRYFLVAILDALLILIKFGLWRI